MKTRSGSVEPEVSAPGRRREAGAITRFTRWFPVALTRTCVRSPGWAIAIAAVIVALAGASSTRLVTEVGFNGYFGADHPQVRGLVAHQREFGVGSQLLAVVSCEASPRCQGFDEAWSLDLLGRFHAALDAVPNVMSATSMLNLPVVTGPLESRPIGRRAAGGGFELAPDWRSLLDRAGQQAFFYGNLVSRDRATAGIVIELASLESTRQRNSVLELLARRHAFEEELGAEIYFTGEPMFNVIGAQTVDRDTLTTTVGLFVAMFGVLWWVFRDPWLTLLPLAAIGPLYLVVQGATAALGIPVSVLMGVVPIVVLIISMTSSIHFMSAFVTAYDKECEGDSTTSDQAARVSRALVSAAGQVGSACFWAGFTTAAGFVSFNWSVLQTFRDAGQMSALGCSLGFVAIFTVLPAAVTLRARRGDWRPAARSHHAAARLAAGMLGFVRRAPRIALAGSLLGLVILAAGVGFIADGGPTGFGERSYVLRSIQFIEERLRKCDTMELVVDIPAGAHVYDVETLQLLAAVEQQFIGNPGVGETWSFLTLLEEAFLSDSGRAPRDHEELFARRLQLMPLVASHDLVRAFWSEREVEPGGVFNERARVAIGRGWHEEDYSDNVRWVEERIGKLNHEFGPSGYRVRLEGGMPLVDTFLAAVRESQWQTLRYAFAIVSVVLIGLLARAGVALVAWSVVANFLPVLAMLGTMGWLGVALDLTNALLGAILLVIVVDDTVHMALHYQGERERGAQPAAALEASVRAVGSAILTSSLCLGLGFCSMLASEWSGLVTFGVFAALGVGFAVVGDLILLPAALLSSRTRQARRLAERLRVADSVRVTS
ncbi:MAG: MMPL family transporter [Myxococcota bacterium]|jgi:hypothetical protein|nr:MMPL family transporter [Myxococcota bacterium]